MKNIKTLAIITLSFFLILTSCNRRSTEQEVEDYAVEEKCVIEDGYFLLLKDNNTISLNTYRDGKIYEHRTFAILSEHSLFATDQKERVVIVDISCTQFRMIERIMLYEIQTSNKIELPIPYEIHAKTILLNADNLFVGGAGNELLVQYHIQNEQWYGLEIPSEIHRPFGRAIDDLVVNDSLLIAIDNIVMPKFIIFYHLNSTGELALSHFRRLRMNGAGEYMRQGRITPDFLGISSSTFGGWAGSQEYITIYRDLDLRYSFAVELESVAQTRTRINTINDFIIVGNKLFVAHRNNGLGVLEIQDSFFQAGWHKNREFNAKVDSNKVNYQAFENEEVIRLTLIPDTTKIVLTIRNSLGKIRHEIIQA